MQARLSTTAISLSLFVGFLVGWEWLPPLLGVPEFLLPGPLKVWSEFERMNELEQLWLHFGITLLEVVAGFTIGSALGVAIGYVLGAAPRLEMILSPYILALQIAPKVAFAPLFVLWLGYTIYPKILVAVLIVFFPVMINVLTAIRRVDPDLVNLARALSASRWQIFRKIECPATLPALFSGLRIAATLCVIGVVVGEFVGGNHGVGYLLVFGEGMGNTAMVFVTIIMLTVIGIAAYGTVVLAESKVLHYLPKAQHRTI